MVTLGRAGIGQAYVTLAWSVMWYSRTLFHHHVFLFRRLPEFNLTYLFGKLNASKLLAWLCICIFFPHCMRKQPILFILIWLLISFNDSSFLYWKEQWIADVYALPCLSQSEDLLLWSHCFSILESPGLLNHSLYWSYATYLIIISLSCSDIFTPNN